MVRDILLYILLIVLFCLIFMAQLLVNVYAFQRQPPTTKSDRADIIFV
ncbi:uncharacterized protein LOC129247730 [Anastrepha obliqua]|nr:PREDICTED: uncharacterized protein LOC108368042 [Rhagoletis zephyria]XP_036324585.1 uncharacterized protein LOC118737883 [Rhagoletis pomonella]XP_053970210.1 uncharacterized protein LOC128871992 [Anastrepha ludens]XP_054742983.1 uncharacterized protein LOC129247730 [Anastrepha obliqua]